MKKSFYKTLLILALPITIQNLILVSVNMADVFMIGKLGGIGTESLAAINIENGFERLAVVGIIGFANAATVMIAHKIGQGKLDEAYFDGKKFLKFRLVWR